MKINNKYFKEAHCSCCGTKGKVHTFHRLQDGSLLCKSCAAKAPTELSEFASGSLSDYKKAIAYAEKSEKEYAPIFDNDAGFYNFEIDSKNMLFRNKNESGLILPLENIVFFDFEFKGEGTTQRGNSHIAGTVYATMVTQNPPVSYHSAIANGLMGKISRSIMSSLSLPRNPEELDRFLPEFETLVNAAKAQEQIA